MAENKKYYWLKLKSDFFDDDTIKYIEEQENGIKYSNFYLKLCLKSLKTNGKLIRLVGETLIPYDVNSLSKLTGVDFDTVRSAMHIFESIGLVKLLDSGEIYLSQINELIGSETDKAQIMRRIRAEKKLNGNIVTQMLPHIEIEKEKEKDIEKEIDIDTEKIIKCYEENIGLFTPASSEIILSYVDDLSADMIIQAIKIASINNKKSARYIQGILNSWINKGYKVLPDIENEKQDKNAVPKLSIEESIEAKREQDLEMYKKLAEEMDRDGFY